MVTSFVGDMKRERERERERVEGEKRYYMLIEEKIDM